MDRIYGVRVTPSQLLLALPFAAKWEVLIILSQCLQLAQTGWYAESTIPGG